MLTVERQVAIALRRFAGGDSLATLEVVFGLSKPAVSNIIWRFIQALNSRAGPIHLLWPVGDRMVEVKRGMERQQGFPNCCGAIDGTHLPIDLPPGQNSMAFQDYKGNTSIAMQAIVDANLRFLDIFVGWGGRVHDTRLLKNSSFYMAAEYDHTILNGPSFMTNLGLPIGEYILGDGGYPVREWLFVPYPGAVGRRQLFNHLLSSTRMCVERAFGRLKGTWRIFSRAITRPNISRLGPTIYAGCVLHNILIDRRDSVDQRLIRNMPPRPPGYGEFAAPDTSRDILGERMRDRLMHHFANDSEHAAEFSAAQAFDPPPRPPRARRARRAPRRGRASTQP